jgi:hypothetical protein
MSGLTNATAAAYIDDSFGTTARTAPTTPMKLSPETTAGTTSAAGTELGSTTRPTITMGAASGTPPVASNSASCTVVAGAGGTVNAIAIYDSAGTPIRKWWGALASSRTVVLGDSLVFAIGAVTASITS